MKWGRGLLALLASACAEPAVVWSPEPAVPEHPSLRLERIYATRVSSEVWIGGFDGAAIGSAKVVVERDGVAVAEASPDAAGRFRIAVPAQEGEWAISPPEGPAVVLRVRDPEVARAAALLDGLGGAGLTPNDLVILGPKQAPFGALVRSGDHAVSAIDLERGIQPDSGRFLERANPWFVAPVDPEGTEVVVSAYATGEVQRLDLVDRARPAVIYRPGGPVALEDPWPLLEPRDVDGDGTVEAAVLRYPLLTPQPVLVLGGRIYAAYTGVISVRLGSRGPVQLPPTLVSWALDDPDHPLRTPLPFHNPQELRALPDGRILVVASGVLDPRGDQVEVRTPSGVVVFDPDTNQVAERWDLQDFGAGTAVLGEEFLWVGSLARPFLRRIPRGGVGEIRELRVNDEEVDSIFRMIELDGGLVAVPSFNTDRLHVLDLRTGELDPAPFFAPFPVGPGRPVFSGLQVVARRPGRIGVDFVGPDLFLLFGPGSAITPLELRKVMGP